MPQIEVSIVLGSFNRLSLLKSTIKSVRENNITVPYEVIVIDGGSIDGSLAWLLKQKDILTIVQHNRGKFLGKTIERKSWGYFMNLGFKIAKGKYILMISDDCILVPNSVMNGINYANRAIMQGDNIGAVAFYWRNWPEMADYWVGYVFGKMFVNHGLYLKKALENVGWLDEDNYHFYHADGDICLKMWEAGYIVVDSPDSYVEHFSHSNRLLGNRNTERQKNDWNTFETKWKVDSIKHDEWKTRQFDDINKSVLKFPLSERLIIKPKALLGNSARMIFRNFKTLKSLIIR
jgi:glycosyltransferase involved in cell wall biosynthesis